MPDPAPVRPRRFYTAVDTAPTTGGGFAVRLDGRTPKSPAGAPLHLPTRALAELCAAEWAAQGDVVEPGSMPAVRLAFTALDRGADARDALADEVARYAGSDGIAYFADAPDALVDRQAARWGPWLDWARDELHAPLVRAEGVVHRPQPPAALDRVRALALEQDAFGLTGLAYACALFGSAVLALAVARSALSGADAHDLARLDEAWQEEQWGVDAEAAARTAGRLRDADLADRWFAALRAPRPRPTAGRRSSNG